MITDTKLIKKIDRLSLTRFNRFVKAFIGEAYYVTQVKYWGDTLDYTPETKRYSTRLMVNTDAKGLIDASNFYCDIMCNIDDTVKPARVRLMNAFLGILQGRGQIDPVDDWKHNLDAEKALEEIKALG